MCYIFFEFYFGLDFNFFICYVRQYGRWNTAFVYIKLFFCLR